MSEEVQENEKNEKENNQEPQSNNNMENTNENPNSNTKEENEKNYCQTDPKYEELLDPQLITKRQVTINNSTSKQMYKFGTARRFKDLKQTRETLFYELPTIFNYKGQSAGFGYGTKSDFTKGMLKGKADKFYDIPREFEIFRRNSPQYSFGRGRELCKRQDQVGRQNFPAPGTYTPNKSFGSDALKFSLFGRTWNNSKSNGYKAGVPGPGQYTYMNINKYGKYPSSTFENSRQSQFLKTPRFNYKYSKNPPPNAYNIETFFNGTGKFFSSKYESQVAKTLGDRPKQFYFTKASTTPGPGAYNIFSELSGFPKSNKFLFSKNKNKTSYDNKTNKNKSVSNTHSHKSSINN